MKIINSNNIAFEVDCKIPNGIITSYYSSIACEICAWACETSGKNNTKAIKLLRLASKIEDKYKNDHYIRVHETIYYVSDTRYKYHHK